MKFKILPITIIACTALIVAKAVSIGQAFLTEPELAELEAPKAAFVAKVPVTPPISDMDDVLDLALAEPASGAPAEEEKKEEKPKNIYIEKPAENIPVFNESEKAMLEKLSARRAELDARQKELEMKEQLLEASSKKLDTKLADLKKLKEETEVLLKTYVEQEDVKIKSLVKMYENMKPKDAAAIFEELDMPILLAIVDKMSERKVSPILAGMSPTKAREVTEELANQRSLTKVDEKQSLAKVDN